MTQAMQAKPVESLSFEQALQELEIIVRQLEEGRVDLEKAITFYERGTTLKKHCEEKLKQAKSRIDQINLDTEGNPRIVSAESLENLQN